MQAKVAITLMLCAFLMTACAKENRCFLADGSLAPELYRSADGYQCQNGEWVKLRIATKIPEAKASDNAISARKKSPDATRDAILSNQKRRSYTHAARTQTRAARNP